MVCKCHCIRENQLHHRSLLKAVFHFNRTVPYRTVPYRTETKFQNLANVDLANLNLTDPNLT
jgi:hypothetical protein